jgi:hypothetical protein
MRRLLLLAAIVGMTMSATSLAASLTEGMKKGTPALKSAGACTFAPEGILLVGDPQAAAIFAIATGDKSAGSPSEDLNIEKIDEKIAALLGTTAKDILINDLAVNPETGSTFLTVSRGKGPDAVRCR